MLEIAKQQNNKIRTDLETLENVVKHKGCDIATANKKDIEALLENSDKISAPYDTLKNSPIFEIIENIISSEKLIAVIKDSVGLYALAVITYPHFMSTRYPDQHLKPNAYNEGLGIVDCFDELSKRTENSINSLEQFINTVQQITKLI